VPQGATARFSVGPLCTFLIAVLFRLLLREGTMWQSHSHTFNKIASFLAIDNELAGKPITSLLTLNYLAGGVVAGGVVPPPMVPPPILPLLPIEPDDPMLPLLPVDPVVPIVPEPMLPVPPVLPLIPVIPIAGEIPGFFNVLAFAV